MSGLSIGASGVGRLTLNVTSFVKTQMSEDKSSGPITIVVMTMLICSCTASCSIPSVVCGWLSLCNNLCLLWLSQLFQSVESRPTVLCSDSRINFLTSVCDPVFFCLLHSSSDLLIDFAVLLRCHMAMIFSPFLGASTHLPHTIDSECH